MVMHVHKLIVVMIYVYKYKYICSSIQCHLHNAWVKMPYANISKASQINNSAGLWRASLVPACNFDWE